MRAQLSEKENLIRSITSNRPEWVPVRTIHGDVPGMARVSYLGSRGPLEGGPDWWGVVWSKGRLGGREWEPLVRGYVIRHPLDLADLEDYPFPDASEPLLLAGLLDGVDRDQVFIVAELPFLLLERAHLLMGMENLFVAMVAQPERVAKLLQRIADYQVGILERYIEMGVDGLRGTDDYGTQQALMISPELWRNLIKPQLARIYGVAKEAGLMIFHHSCGHIMEIVPDLVELGVDVLDPVQARANDHAILKRLYGDKISFMGGVDTQDVLTRGTPEEVETHVRERIQLLAPGGGYILGPDNVIPIPRVNYEAYLTAGKRYGRYPLENCSVSSEEVAL